jgi:predicted metal-dependent phosphoesterase TrpH/glycosyltransferase involved in cell wall biosynthesis
VSFLEDSLRIALLTPFQWLLPGAVNQHVAALAEELLRLGHRPVVLASSNDLGELERMRLLCRRRQQLALGLLGDWQPAAAPDPRLLAPEGTGPLRPEQRVPVIPLGRSFPIRLNGSVASIGLPVDVTSRLEGLLVGGGFDVVHVHEPIAPSLAFTAIREARCPVVSTFHLTPVGLLAYELEQGILAPFYRQLDGRAVTAPRGAAVLADFFGGDYRVIFPGTRVEPLQGRSHSPAASAPATRALYVFRGDERRGLRALFRALAAAPQGVIDELVVAVHRASAYRWHPRRAPRALRSQVRVVEFDEEQELSPLYAETGVAILPYLGGEWLLTSAAEAFAAGCPFLGADFPITRDFLALGGQGRLFAPETEASFADALAGLAREGRALPDPVTEPSRRDQSVESVARAVLQLYAEAQASTKAPGPRAHRPPQRVTRRAQRALEARVGERPSWLYADLHIHTDHSKDSTNSVEAVLATAREVGLGAIAVADHNVISGALAARDLAGDGTDLLVIVAEEVKTSDGEVIGMFLEELIPRGLTFNQTLSLIKDQGGLVYVPHPFDRLRTTPVYRLLVENVHRIDVIETYNARNYLGWFNLEAERFAAKYNLAAGAGSDAHVLPGIGRAMLRMPRFTGREDFLDSLRGADILTRRKGLLYLQSLKLLQTTLDRVLPGVESREA